MITHHRVKLVLFHWHCLHQWNYTPIDYVLSQTCEWTDCALHSFAIYSAITFCMQIYWLESTNARTERSLVLFILNITNPSMKEWLSQVSIGWRHEHNGCMNGSFDTCILLQSLSWSPLSIQIAMIEQINYWKYFLLAKLWRVEWTFDGHIAAIWVIGLTTSQTSRSTMWYWCDQLILMYTAPVTHLLNERILRIRHLQCDLKYTHDM